MQSKLYFNWFVIAYKITSKGKHCYEQTRAFTTPALIMSRAWAGAWFMSIIPECLSKQQYYKRERGGGGKRTK